MLFTLGSFYWRGRGNCLIYQNPDLLILPRCYSYLTFSKEETVKTDTDTDDTDDTDDTNYTDDTDDTK